MRKLQDQNIVEPASIDILIHLVFIISFPEKKNELF